jgi:hypothetical protein
MMLPFCGVEDVRADPAAMPDWQAIGLIGRKADTGSGEGPQATISATRTTLSDEVAIVDDTPAGAGRRFVPAITLAD